jgi:glucose/arabinose dehydrogenase/type 1 glutamine amidotransferase
MRLALALCLILLSPLATMAQLVEGRFGQALPSTIVEGEPNPVYICEPMTVECWAKLTDKSKATILVANENRNSGSHWSLYVERQTGCLSGRVGSHRPADVHSDKKVADGQWHHLAMTFDGSVLKLYVDAEEVAEQKLAYVFQYPDTGPLFIGHDESEKPTAGAVIDEVRISRSIRPLDKLPTAPFKPDADTAGLWHFDAVANGALADASRTDNPLGFKAVAVKSAMSENNNRWMEMDWGRFFTASYIPNFPAKNNATAKGIAIRLGKNKEAAVCFDTELLRVTIAWTGEFIKLPAGREGLSGPPTIAGTPVFGTLPLPGWSTTSDFTDPRPDKLGPLPTDIARYKGLYVNGDRIILSYTVARIPILESFDFDSGIFERNLHIAAHNLPLYLRLCDLPGTTRFAAIGGSATTATNPANQVILSIPPSDKPQDLKVLISSNPSDFDQAVKTEKPPQDLTVLTHGGPARYPQTVETQGQLGPNTQAYTVDTLTAPETNPWKSFLRFGGHDFFSNGDCAVCSVSGDVWVVSGIDDKLEHLKWRRFATGLHQPLGLRILKDQVYVLGRDQITRLIDLNNDGEADFYECFNNGCKTTANNGHAYVTNLETDQEGNFYYTKCGDNTEHGGTILKVSADGSKIEIFATGLRNPNGMGVSPTGEITEADNEGEWVPASRIDLVHPGQFLGYTPMSKQKTPPKHPGYPICWMPQNCDNSSGGQTWVNSDRWGPFSGEMIHTSYGAAAIYHVMTETINGQMQGGVYRFPLNFASGIMRARFNPKDGQLYVSGLRGWQTTGQRSGALQRVRFTGQNVYQPAALHAHANGMLLSFTSALDAKTAADPENWSVLQWNYRWSAAYGSKHWSVEEPKKQGYDDVAVKSATLLKDGKTVFLEMDDLQPVMQMMIGYKIKAADGANVKGEVFNTIHNLGSQFLIEDQPKPKKIILIAGKKSHGPGEHEYQKGCELLKKCLETAPNVKNIKVELVLDGWPSDESILDDADTILIYADGSDQDEKRDPLLVGDRLSKLGKLMDKGCGLVSLHYTIFKPTDRGGKQFQDWLGGYFDYDSKGTPKDHKTWVSTLGMNDFTTTFLTPNHPIVAGCKPFKTRTEYYWKMALKENDPDRIPLATFDPSAPGTEALVAWAVERKNGHRGFVFTGGHYHHSWAIDPYRRMVLNALLWTAHAPVPDGGVESKEEE